MLKKLRKKLDLSRKEFSSRIGATWWDVVKWQNDWQKLHPQDIMKIKNTFGCDVTDVIEFSYFFGFYVEDIPTFATDEGKIEFFARIIKF